MNLDRYSEDPLLADFAWLERGRARVLFRRGHDPLAAAIAEERAGTGAEMRVEGGRQPHPVVELGGGGRAVVRAYQRGGAVRHLNRERYFLGHRAFEELRVTEHARAAGVRTPLVLAAAEYEEPIGYRAALATRWIPGALELPRWLAESGAGEHAGVMGEVGRQISIMHEGGIAHPDLNLRNLLVAREPEDGLRAVYVLDFDRGRLFPGAVPAARRARELRRFARSAGKLRAPIGAAGWAALRNGYGSGWPLAGDLG